MTGGKHLGDAEIGNLDDARRVPEDVRRLDVAVNDAAVVRVFQRRTDLQCGIQNFFPRQPAMLQQQLLVVVTGDIFHRVVEQTFLHARFIKLDDVGMAELAEDLDFSLEALEKAGFLGQLRGQHLERCQVAVALLMGHVHPTHAATAQFLVQNPLPQPRPDHCCDFPSWTARS